MRVSSFLAHVVANVCSRRYIFLLLVGNCEHWVLLCKFALVVRHLGLGALVLLGCVIEWMAVYATSDWWIVIKLVIGDWSALNMEGSSHMLSVASTKIVLMCVYCLIWASNWWFLLVTLESVWVKVLTCLINAHHVVSRCAHHHLHVIAACSHMTSTCSYDLFNWFVWHHLFFIMNYTWLSLLILRWRLSLMSSWVLRSSTKESEKGNNISYLASTCF